MFTSTNQKKVVKHKAQRPEVARQRLQSSPLDDIGNGEGGRKLWNFQKLCFTIVPTDKNLTHANTYYTKLIK